MKRVYLLSSKIPGVTHRLVSAHSRAGALAIASELTWDATPADGPTQRAFESVGMVVEGGDPAQGELLATEGGEA